MLVREVHDHGHGATVLPYDAKRGTVLLVRQFRLPAYLHDHDGFIIETCAGLLDGDDPAQCAKREAEEELGFRLANLRYMTTVYMTPGAVTERLSLFIADYDHDARIGAGGGEAHEGEDIEVIEMRLRRDAPDGAGRPHRRCQDGDAQPVPRARTWPSAVVTPSLRMMRSVPASQATPKRAAAIERCEAAIVEALRHVAQLFGREVQHQRRLQRPMDEQARIAFLFGMAEIVVDAVAVEGEGREAEQQQR